MITNREEYYSQPMVLYNLVNQLKYKYLSCRKVKPDGKAILSRYYMGYSLDLLKQSLEKLNVLNDTSAKLYFDLSYWKNDEGKTPLFNFDNVKRKEDKKKFNEEFSTCFVGYDFGIDIDAKDLKIAHRDTQKIKKLFDKYKLPYSLKFSGGKGFHFLIQDKWFSHRMKAKNKVLLFQRLSKVIIGVCGLKSVNDGGTFDDTIYDDRRIFKLAYSLQNKNGKEYCVLPLSDFQFDNFKLEHMGLSNVMIPSYCKLFKRGLLERDFGLTEKQLKCNILKFLKECK